MKGFMKGPPRIIRHRLVVYLFGEAIGDAEKRAADEVYRRAARRPDELVDGLQLLHQVLKRLRVLYPQIDGAGNALAGKIGATFALATGKSPVGALRLPPNR